MTEREGERVIVKDAIFTADVPCAQPRQATLIPISLAQSVQGKYFVGQTDNLWVGNGSFAWACLYNPAHSGTLLFANVMTVSNFSNSALTAEIWLNAELPEIGMISPKVSPSNTALQPAPAPSVQIRYVQSTKETPRNGVNIFDRIVPPAGTLVSEEDGKFIVPPGGNYAVFIKSPSAELSRVIVAFGWWEDPA